MMRGGLARGSPAAAFARAAALARVGAARRLLGAAMACVLGSAAFATDGDAALGRQIYLEGRAGTASIAAHRAGGIETRGQAGACVNCHRRSAMGGAEGRTYVPPIDARALFTEQPSGSGASASGLGRDAYTDATLARALSQGVDPSGRTLDYLMPRYRLDAHQSASLSAYLRTLSGAVPPGIAGGTAHLASVIAGDVPADQRRRAEALLRACVAEHNAGPADTRRRQLLSRRMQRAAPAPWALHVWELSGPASTWAAQLRGHAQRQPVFAMLGGLVGEAHGGDWAPVQRFCEREAIPCLYPHLDAPPLAEPNHYSFFVSGGVELEAALIARHLQDAEEGSAGRAARVTQWLRAGDHAARRGAEALHKALAAHGIQTLQRDVAQDAPAEPDRTEQAVQVLWLRAADLANFPAPSQPPSLPHSPLPPPDAPLYVSATLLAHKLDALPPALKRRAIVAHPHELPQRRAGRTATLGAWLAKQGLSIDDEALAADTLLACDALRNGMHEVVQRPGAEYLIERLEVIAERSGFAGLYPRLSLGSGQRIASKTGYLVRFAGPDLRDLEALGDPIAP